MKTRTYTPAEQRAILEERAKYDHNARVVLGIRRSREAGLTRQMTTEEIAAKYFGWSPAQTREALGK